MLDRSANDALVSGTGLFACQLAKHVFRAGKVITTVSTAKIPKIKDLLGEGTIDEGKTVLAPSTSFSLPNFRQVIDYTKSDPRDVIEHGTVDFLFDTVGLAMVYLCLMRPGSSRIVSVATLPSGNQLQSSSLVNLPHRPAAVPFPFRMALDLLDQIRKVRACRYQTEYSYMFLESTGEDLDDLTRYVEDGRLRTIVGSIVDIRDVEAVREACEVVYSGRGGLGKSVIRISTPELSSHV
jgi:NADPH:quinone reductase-like Zn-dependent oxidoreductase